ncbi:hypothetical protein [Methanoculleus chikugoensis]|uniref:Yip1 family protein n=1 Tax=Methanoculleus chikugoensis TaxID=118126 RepID=UPI0006D1AFC6|nr:Yip1 family protein [Methanoculleus chikugoensis]
MPYSFTRKVTGIFFRSTDTFRALEEEHFVPALFHFLKLTALFSLLMTATLYTLPGIPIARRWSLTAQALQPPQDFFVVLLVATVMMPLLVGVWLHIWVYIFGGRRGIGQTLKAAMYSYTPPFYIIAWIPILGLIGGAASTLYPPSTSGSGNSITCRRAGRPVPSAPQRSCLSLQSSGLSSCCSLHPLRWSPPPRAGTEHWSSPTAHICSNVRNSPGTSSSIPQTRSRADSSRREQKTTAA